MYAQSKVQADSDKNAKSSAEIDTLMAEVKKRMTAGNYDTLTELYAEDFVMAMSGVDIIEGREKSLATVKMMYGESSGELKQTLVKRTIRGDMAVDVGSFSYIEDGKETKGSYCVTFKKDDGKWRLNSDFTLMS